MLKRSISLEQGEEQALIQNGTVTLYRRHEIIFTAGQPAQELHYILSGWVNVFKVNDQGRQVSVGLRYQGDFVGLSSFACNQERGSFGQAMMNSKIVSIPREKMHILFKTMPGLMSKFFCLMGTCLQDTQSNIVYFLSHQTDKRLILTLMNIACYLGQQAEDGKRLVNLTLSQEEMAHIVGCSRQTVNNVLTKLRHGQYIEMNGREIVAIYPERLAENYSEW
mgnify:CR=1 FL=1